MAVSDEVINNVLGEVITQIMSRRERQGSTIDFNKQQPFVLGITGLQGSGKSTWTKKIHDTLRNKHNFNVVSLSLDDLYLNHDGLVKTRELNPDNPLFRTRGQPG